MHPQGCGSGFQLSGPRSNGATELGPNPIAWETALTAWRRKRQPLEREIDELHRGAYQQVADAQRTPAVFLVGPREEGL